MEKDIKSRINYLKTKLANRGGNHWIVEGLRKELERLEIKLAKKQAKSHETK